MAFAVVLDTCVLYPANLRDSLLRLAEAGLYAPRWSAGIREELSRNLLELGINQGSVERLLEVMAAAFPEADVTGYERLIESMTCDEKDRHVLAAAVRANASALVTFNVRDFPPASVGRLDIDIVHPDDFLLDLLDLAPRAVVEALRVQVAQNRRQPLSWTSLLEVLERAGVPRFVAELRRRG